MKLTIESMMYGTDGLAHTDNGKRPSLCRSAVAGDTVEAKVVQDGKSFMRARTTRFWSQARSHSASCPSLGICGGCSWGNLTHGTARRQGAKACALHARAHRQVSLLSRLMSWCSPSATPRTTGATASKIRARTDRRQRSRAPGMHGVDSSKIVTIDTCPLFDKRFPKALKSVVGALNYLSGSHDLGLRTRGHSRIAPRKGTRVALWTPQAFPRS